MASGLRGAGGWRARGAGRGRCAPPPSAAGSAGDVPALLLPVLLLVALLATAGASASGGPKEDYCSVRTDVPCLRVPACDSQDAAAFSDFKVTSTGDAATQNTQGTVCWSTTGLHVRETATDDHIFSPYTTCDAEVFSRSDVLEVFVAPVLDVHDNPIWYFELDASPSGALWAGLSNNSLGNASTCVDAAGCTRAGTLNCTGLADFGNNLTVSVANSTGAWSTDLHIPWTLFAPAFRPGAHGSPWKTWRINFYRYSYPDGPNANFSNFELNAWSPTLSSSFHVPGRFGVMALI